MRLIGFSLNKIHVEKFPKKFENVNINTKIDVLSIEEAKSEFFKFKEEAIVVNFSFIVMYEPELATIDLSGSLILAVDSKISKEVLKSWKDKKLPEEFRILLFNLILKKSTLKALQLEEELNLPAHIPFPSFKKQDKED